VGVRNMSNTFDKLSVLDSFIEEVNSYLPEIEANLERLAQSPGDMDALEETYRRTHTIGGSASMMDFSGLAHVAHGMEDILGDALDGLTTLDEATISLLQRSLRRVRLLLNGIRSRIKEDPIVAEDDADYEQYHARRKAAQQELPSVSSNSIGVVTPSPSASIPFVQSSPASSLPSFDEVLASFRSSVSASDGEPAWPESPVLPSAPSLPAIQQGDAQPPAAASIPPAVDHKPQSASSALDELVASTRQLSAEESLLRPTGPSSPLAERDGRSAQSEDAAVLPAPVPIPTSAAVPEATIQLDILPTVYTRVQDEAQSLEMLVASFKQLVVQLRAVIAIIEAQRSEFKGFLDGSKDALERMEDWAGRAMGLNLRNSPEQVRRYLPLSVMWVSNTKLKKVQDVLLQITSGAETTDEQLQALARQLQSSLAACVETFQQMQARATRVLRQESGWTPWEMEVSRDANGTDQVRERVTFERQGDLATIRAEIEAKVRDELRREYESRTITSGERIALEQQIRNEIRQEFEARQQLQLQITGQHESLQELEARLRNEIEIQVRQEFLDTVVHNGSDARAFMGLAPTVPTTSNFLDQARAATGIVEPPSQTPLPASQTQPAIQSTAMSTPGAQPLATTVPSTPSLSHTGVAVTQAFNMDFAEEASEIFRLEAEEHLQSISMHVAALEKSPTNRELIQGIRRATHTLKGAASMMGFRAIADLCHVSEDLLDSIMEGTTSISPAVLSIILDTAETLDSLITGKAVDPATDEAKVQKLRARHAALLGEHLSASSQEDTEVEDHQELTSSARSVAGVLVEEESERQRAAPGDLSVRVRLQKLDELVNLFGELLVNRSVLEERIGRLTRIMADISLSSTRLRDVGQKLESGFEAATLPSGHSVQVMPGDGDQNNAMRTSSYNSRNGAELAHLAEFDELELDRYTEFHRLARGLSEGISDMITLSSEMEATIRECEGVFSRESRLSTTFQDRLMKVRLVPLSTMAPRLYRAARAVALKQHKEFEFLLEGEETEVDRTVYEELAGPLLHLMRNAVNHAIETPEVRVQKGKPPTGQIKLSAFYEGNQVVITIRDDGIGIDPEHVSKAAIAHGLIQPDQVLSESDLVELIFRPGFSTAEMLSEESGRGVGLDVVRDAVSRLRGTIEVESTPGQGTAFTMKFPTSLAIQSAMMVGVGGQQFAIPTMVVEAIGRLDSFKRGTLAGQSAVVVRNDLYPLHMLAQYLSLPVGQLHERAQLLLVNAGGHRVALVVDEIKGKMDIVMKSLGSHLRHVHGIAGGAVLGNGQVVLILELSELLATRTKGGLAPTRREETAVRQPAVPIRQIVDVSESRQNRLSASIGMPVSGAASAERGRYVLVVDDSPSVRRVVGGLLKQNGWEVQMARDGLEALDVISRETPAAILLDIEMPRMDGYELIATVRAQEQYRTLPLVVLTSRAAAKHQQRAMQLGASDYVIKPYQDEELLGKLNALVYGTAVR
jgi:chemotaxis protein histidine kinase CheA/ActR/RegA family two-component response regulator